MTNELEKQFFDTFGIEQQLTTCEAGRWGKCPNPKLCIDICSYKKSTKFYPQITDRILLELTAIHSSWCLPRLCCFNVEQLKEQVLSDLTLFNDKKIELIHQVRTLFEEG